MTALGSKLVSASIPTLNSSRTLARCLAAIRNQTYAPIEIIVVDAYSSDDTARIARSFGAKVMFEFGLTKQRLRCIHESKGDFALLLDSDQVIDVNLVEKCVSKLEGESGIDALVVKDISLPSIDGFLGRAQSRYVELTQSDPDLIYGTALPRFFRSRVLRSLEAPRRELGYFDHAWIYNRVLQKGAKVGYVDAVDYHLEYNSTLRVVRKFFKYYGHYLVPALVEDWKLVLGKSIPKRAVLAPVSNIGIGERIGQLLLFEVKALSTLLGIMHSIFSAPFRRRPLANHRMVSDSSALPVDACP